MKELAWEHLRSAIEAVIEEGKTRKGLKKQQIMDIIESYSICNAVGMPDFPGDNTISTVHYIISNAEELADRIGKLYE